MFRRIVNVLVVAGVSLHLFSSWQFALAQVSFDRKTLDSNFAAYFNLAFDFNQDGPVDILSGNMELAWWENDGTGHFSKHYVDGGVSSLWSIFPVDVDQDGDNDLLIADSGNHDIVWYRNEGGSFSRIVIESGYTNAESVAGADFDRDGDIDIVGLTWGTSISPGMVSIWENDGGQNFYRQDLDINFWSGHKLNVADLNGDGYVDIVAVKASQDGLLWYENRGNLNFSRHVISGRGGLGFYIVDMDENGTLDLLFCDHGHGDVLLFYNNGTGSFSSKIVIASGLNWPSFAAPGDFNADGRLDVVVANRDSNELIWLENLGNDQFSVHPVDSNVSRPFTCDAADFDGDNVSDIVSGSKDAAELIWWHTNATGTSPTPTLTVTYPNGGESFTAGTVEDILWNSSGDISSVRIEYTTDDGQSWQTIASSTTNTGSYSWDIPQTESNQCRIRVSDASSGSPSDVSDNLFSIHIPAPITVLTPNGGESWSPNTTRTIEWSTDHSFDYVRIEYTLDGGSSWSTIVDYEVNDGSYDWNIPGVSSDNCLVKIMNAGDHSVSDESDSPFSILDVSESMVIDINCDDIYELYVNGSFVGQNDQWDVAQEYVVPVRDGENVLAVYGRNRSNAKGLIAEVKVNGDVVLQTDANWVHSSTDIPGWTDIQFDDSGWDPVTDLGQYGVEPWGKGIANFPQNSSAHWIWGDAQEEYFRGHFTNHFSPAPSYTISGQTLYYSNDNPIPNAEISMGGDFSATSVSSSTGDFSFGSVPENSSVFFTASKAFEEDVGTTTILSYDAALASRYSVGLINLSPYEQIAADVDKNHEVSSFDAAAISRYAVALPPLDGTFVAEWTFQPETLQVDSIANDVTGLRFDGILLGDVKGGWNLPSMAKYAGDQTPAGGHFLKPTRITSGDTTTLIFALPYENHVISFDLRITYSFEDYNFLEYKIIPGGSGLNVVYNSLPGDLRIGAYAANFLKEDYQVQISFLHQNSSSSSIIIQKFVINNEIILNHSAITADLNNPSENHPLRFQFQQNYPNPFNSQTVLRYTLPEPGQVNVSIFDLGGHLMKTLQNSRERAGNYEVIWDGRDQTNHPVSSGIYFVRLCVQNRFVHTIKINLLR